MEEVKRGRGRPTVGERVPLGLRVTPDLKRKLDAAAEQSGRSQSQEAELRLEHTFDRQGLLSEVLTLTYGKEIAVDLMWAGAVMKLHRQGWESPGSKEFRDFMIATMRSNTPPPDALSISRRVAAAFRTIALAGRKER